MHNLVIQFTLLLMSYKKPMKMVMYKNFWSNFPIF